MKGNIEISYLQKEKYVLLKNRRHFTTYLYSIKIETLTDVFQIKEKSVGKKGYINKRYERTKKLILIINLI